MSQTQAIPEAETPQPSAEGRYRFVAIFAEGVESTVDVPDDLDVKEIEGSIFLRVPQRWMDISANVEKLEHFAKVLRAESGKRVFALSEEIEFARLEKVPQ